MTGKATRPRSTISFLRSLAAGLKRGDFFPGDGRRPPQSAPSGTHEEVSRAGLLARLRGETGWFSRSHHQLIIPRLNQRIRVLHLTDIHIRTPSPWLDSLCDALSRERPDLVVITGDVVTKGWTEAAVRQFLQALPPAPLGHFAVMGNWEHWSGADLGSWSELCLAHGVEVLQNRWVERSGIVIAGTDDWLSGEPDIQAALSGIPETAPVLVLTHSPGIFNELCSQRVDLVLSGHSHGGQVRIPLLGALWVPSGTSDRVAGWYQEQGAHLFVSRGLGWSIAPLRLWCPPELPTIELRPGPS